MGTQKHKSNNKNNRNSNSNSKSKSNSKSFPLPNPSPSVGEGSKISFSPSLHHTMTTIKTIHAREILDSRGNPTLEAEITLHDGSFCIHRRARSGGAA